MFDKHALWRGPSLPAYVPPAGTKPRTEPGQVIEPRMRRRLMRGRIEIDGTIDLHGMRQAEARAALQRFVVARAVRGDRTLLVITGKGLKKTDDLQIVDRGVLRSMLPVWLSEPTLAPLIAGWDVSAQSHGGDGAFYVRLRRAAR
ncbi:MAG: Smr/MutS family protein [Devosia sp.]|nr:Smr/MutS family protein [Devosia sp.]